MEINEQIDVIVAALEEKKALDIAVYDISKVSSLCDFFIVATGNNRNQMQALADNVSVKLADKGIVDKKSEGYDSRSWILADYKDFMVHIFNPESRSFYNLDRMWKDTKVN